MSILLTRVLTATRTFVARHGVWPKSFPIDPSVPVQVTVSSGGELETFATRPGKIYVEGQPFKVWRNTLIICDPTRHERRSCHLVESSNRGGPAGSEQHATTQGSGADDARNRGF
jgi:hypothetical protein